MSRIKTMATPMAAPITRFRRLILDAASVKKSFSLLEVMVNDLTEATAKEKSVSVTIERQEEFLGGNEDLPEKVSLSG